MNRLGQKRKLFFAAVALVLSIILCLSGRGRVSLAASETSEISNASTDGLYLDDGAGLLTEEEEGNLKKTMQQILPYGGCAFVTTSDNYETASDYARSRYRDYFGTASGVLFLIDMNNRRIEIFSDGAIYRVITKNYANTITDNVYTYAKSGDYYTCANEAFLQIRTLLAGGRITQPMKYICNALIALIAAFLLQFAFVRSFSKTRKASRSEILGAAKVRFQLRNVNATYLGRTKEYSPVSSSSGGHSGGGGGGGHSSGGGGGHSF